MSPRWSSLAIDDLIALRSFIAQQDPAGADRISHRIVEIVERLLPVNPQMGRPGRVPGTREFVIPGATFIVPYRLAGDTIQILRVYHSSRR